MIFDIKYPYTAIAKTTIRRIFMKHILKLALPVIVIIALGGLIISSMQNPNPIVVVATIGLATIVLFSRIIKIKKNAKKHYRKATQSSRSTGSSASRSTSGGMSGAQAQALQGQLNAIARSHSGTERLTAHADIRISVTSRGDGSFNISTEIIRDGHEESYSPQVDSAAQTVINDLEWKLSNAVENLR